ncbi:MAG TPA: right-handed parallel beta-helix repeat-containing protein, partial [Gemmatimonadales bacterium]|nr:right-handed parallel beta-helix repeat-containing protein [Gemmatimonadales bacterium]
LAGSAMRIRNSRIVGNAGTGVRVGSGVDEFTGNRVTLNGGYPMSTGPQGLEALEDQDADSMLGNATDQILVDKNGTIGTRNVTIRQRLPWRVQDGFVTVGGGRTLGVEPGTTIVMDGGGAGLWIGGGPFGGQGSGRLLAEGTTTDPIRFVAATPATRWHVLAINQHSDTSKLRHVSIEHGGNSGWPAALTIGDALGRPVILDAVTVRQSAADGINANILAVQGPVYADSNGGRGMVLFGRDVTLTDARFMGNGSDGLWTSQSARNLSVRRSLFYRNGAAGAHLNGDSTTMDSSTVRRNGSGLAFCCDGNNPLRPRLLRSTVDSNLAHGVSTSGSVGGIIQDNLIAVNGGTGLVHHNGGLVTGNRIRGNGRSLTVNALALGATTGQSIDSLLGNVGDTLTVECCSGDEEVIAGDTIRTRPELPWRVDVGLRFINRTVWKVEPGSSVFLNGGRIQIGQNPSCDPGTQGAVLLAESDDAAPIRFTSRNPTRGAWSQILLECLSDTVRLRNVEVSYAGSGAQDAIRIAPGTAGVRVVLDSVRVRQSAAGGLLIQTGTNVLIGRYLAADSTNSYGLQVDARDVAVPAGRFTANQTGIQVFGRRFSLANAAVSGNGPTGIEIHADSATITGSTVESNGGSGILANCCTAGHALNGLLVQNNAGDGLRLHASSTSLTGNTVVANGGYGVFGDQYQTFSAFTGNTVSGNGNYPVLLDGGSLGAFAGQDQAALLGNGRDTLCICSGPSFAPFTTGSPTLGATLPWRNQVSLVVGGDQTLTVEPGATLVMDNGAALFVGTGDGAYRGRLLALGTAANPVRVMGRDTTVRGFWHQLAIQNQSDSSILRHVELVGGGGTSSLQQLYAGDLAGLPIRLDTVTVRKSATHGVWFGGSSFRINGLRSLDNQESGVVLTGGAVTLSDSRLESNGFAGLRVDGGGGHVIGGAVGSILAGNGSWGVYNGTADLVTATMNWWGHGCGPGCNGTNPVFGNVDASAPLAAPPGIP